MVPAALWSHDPASPESPPGAPSPHDPVGPVAEKSMLLSCTFAPPCPPASLTSGLIPTGPNPQRLPSTVAGCGEWDPPYITEQPGEEGCRAEVHFPGQAGPVTPSLHWDSRHYIGHARPPRVPLSEA